MPYHHIKAPSQRELSPSGDWGSHPKYSCISAFFINSSFSRLCGSLLPSRLTPCHLPLRGRLLPYHHIKAPSQRELSPKVTEGVTQNTPASVPFSTVPAFLNFAVRSASADLFCFSKPQIDLAIQLVVYISQYFAVLSH